MSTLPSEMRASERYDAMGPFGDPSRQKPIEYYQRLAERDGIPQEELPHYIDALRNRIENQRRAIRKLHAQLNDKADVAAATAHRACCGEEHDPANGKLHGACVICGVPWPCETAQYFLRKPL